MHFSTERYSVTQSAGRCSCSCYTCLYHLNEHVRTTSNAGLAGFGCFCLMSLTMHNLTHNSVPVPTPCATCFHLMYVTEAIEFISTQSLRNSCYLVSFTVCNRTKTAPSFVYNSHEGAVFKLVHKPLNCEFVFSTCDLELYNFRG